jgi:MarR family transcriptional regulator, organic hydroperoxide resistance regulator
MSFQRLEQSLLRIERALARIERRCAVDTGLTVSQVRVLAQLGRSDSPITITDIAQEQCLAVSTMTRNVAGLKRRGWVIRNASLKDRRSVDITLSPEGELVYKRICEHRSCFLRSALGGMHPGDRVEKVAALQKVAAALEGISVSS